MNVVDSSDDDKARARKRLEEKAEAARQLAEQQMRADEEKEMAAKAKEDRSAKRKEFKEAGYRQSDPNLFNISEEEIRKREQQLAVRARFTRTFALQQSITTLCILILRPAASLFVTFSVHRDRLTCCRNARRPSQRARSSSPRCRSRTRS